MEPATILAHIQHIQRDQTPAAEFPVGVLTSEDRDVWAAAREMLVDNGKFTIDIYRGRGGKIR